jgi:uridine kinase
LQKRRFPYVKQASDDSWSLRRIGLGQNHLGSATHDPTGFDHYYKDLSQLPQSERDQRNFDHPDALDLELLRQHLELLQSGISIERPTYDFASHTRVAQSTLVEPTKVMIVDGILALHHSEIRRLFQLAIYVDVDDDLRFIRRLRRDITERGRTLDGVIQQYLTTIKLMHDSYVAPQKFIANMIISWRDDNDQAVRMLCDILEGVLEHHGES